MLIDYPFLLFLTLNLFAFRSLFFGRLIFCCHIVTSVLLSQKKLKESPFIDFKEDAIYVEPKYKCNVEFLEKTKSNHLRHPVFKEEI